VEPTLKGQADAAQNGLRWKYWRIRSFDQVERKGELEEGIPEIGVRKMIRNPPIWPEKS
jgi:hypothetical protein